MAGKWRKHAKFLSGVLSVCVAAALVLSTTATTVAYAADDISSLKQKQAAYAQQKKENDAKLTQLRQDKSKKEEYKQTLQNQITTLQNQIDTYNTQIADLDDSILQSQQQIAAKQKDISADTAKLKERLCALYMSGGASNLELLFSAKDVADLADKTEALQMVTSHDTALISKLRSEMSAVKKQKESIEQNREEAADAKTAVAGKQSELSGLASEVQTVISSLSTQESSLQSQSDSLAQQEAAADQAVDKWYADYQASQKKKQVEAAQKAAQQKAAASSSQTSGSTSTGTSGSSQHSSTSGGSSSSGASASGSGSMMWPVPSCQLITSPFGHRSSPGGIGSTYHKGIDIGASYGSAIVAADSGTIIQAGDNGWGYGNLVMIDHGNGVITYYGHMSSVAVSDGQTVAKGQIIGYVGSTGNSTGPHCHFEIRVNGTAVDPSGYV